MVYQATIWMWCDAEIVVSIRDLKTKLRFSPNIEEPNWSEQSQIVNVVFNIARMEGVWLVVEGDPTIKDLNMGETIKEVCDSFFSDPILWFNSMMAC